MGKLKNRVSLITGASRGIGRAVAERFAAEGASVVAVARNEKMLGELAASINTKGGACRTIAFDLGDLAAIDRLADELRTEFGKLDILIANAAVFPGHIAVHELTPEMMRETMHINFFANWYLLRACHDLLRRSDAGRVIFVTTRGAYSPHPGWAAYKASKAALDRVMSNYALENEGHGIHCNSLSPGPVVTEMGIFANEGHTPDMVPAEDVVPMFLRLADPDLKETGKMFDYRDFKGTVAIAPWAQFTTP